MSANSKKMFSRLPVVLFGLALLACCSLRGVYEKPEAHSHENALNINTATTSDLEKLPHIGRKTAESIVEFRETNGPFRKVEHLMQIRGISEERFLELRPYLKIE